MYGMFTYIWLKFMANVGKYTIHGVYGLLIDLSWKNPTEIMDGSVGWEKEVIQATQSSASKSHAKFFGCPVGFVRINGQ